MGEAKIGQETEKKTAVVQMKRTVGVLWTRQPYFTLSDILFFLDGYYSTKNEEQSAKNMHSVSYYARFNRGLQKERVPLYQNSCTLPISHLVLINLEKNSIKETQNKMVER